MNWDWIVRIDSMWEQLLFIFALLGAFYILWFIIVGMLLRQWKWVLSMNALRCIAKWQEARYRKNPKWKWANDFKGHYLEPGDWIRCFAYGCGCLGGIRRLKVKKNSYRGVRHSFNDALIGSMDNGGRMFYTEEPIAYKPKPRLVVTNQGRKVKKVKPD